jgi:hypothetical protein
LNAGDGGTRRKPAGTWGLSVCAMLAADFGIQDSVIVLALVKGGETISIGW